MKGYVSRLASMLMLTFLAQFCGGCGLVLIPTLETYPAPVKEVQVRDGRTRSLIPGAKVRYIVIPREYKGYPWDELEPIASAGACWEPSDPHQVKALPLKRVENGRFVPSSDVMFGVWQWLWPLWSWSTRGDFEYYGHKSQITASACGYISQEIEFPAGLNPDKFHPDQDELDHGVRFTMSRDGVLVFFLRELPDTARRSASRAADGFRYRRVLKQTD